MVDPAEPGRAVGTVTRRALLGAFDRELFQRDVLLTRVVWREGSAEAADYLELPPGRRVEVVAPPASLVGAPLDVGDVRRRFRVTVIAIRRSGGEHPWRDPEEAGALAADDRVMAVGEPEAIESFRAGRARAPEEG